tara:strand:- start:557 stop:835 length:279 start_codon:yes stop_codon:yes gene_type:complete
MIFNILTSIFSNEKYIPKDIREKKIKEKKDIEPVKKTDVYLNRTKSDIKTMCPISSFKQCSNNFNSDFPIKNTLTFEKPNDKNRVNMWNTTD